MRRIALVLALGIPFSGRTQEVLPEEAPSWRLGLRGSWGWLSPHHASMWYLVESHALMGELFYERPFSGKLGWHHDYARPSWGVGLLLTDAGSPTHLGTVSRMLSYLDLPLVRGARTSFNARIGWGLGWVQDPYDRRDNHRQLAIGSRVNAAVILALELQRTIGRDILSVGASLDHQSNGSLQVPNLGINLVTVNISWRHGFSEMRTFAIPTDTSRMASHGWTTQVMTAWGYQEVEPFGSGKHSVFILSGSMYRRTTPKSSFGAGVDLFNKASLTIRDPELADRSRSALTQLGAHIGYVLHFGDLSILIDQGVYLVSPIDEQTALYQRIGIRQLFCRRFFANLSLKTHFGAADHFELGLGYQWR